MRKFGSQLAFWGPEGVMTLPENKNAASGVCNGFAMASSKGVRGRIGRIGGIGRIDRIFLNTEN